MIKKITFSFIKWFVMIVLLIFAAVPILQVFLNSFRTDSAVKRMPFGLPEEWVFNNWPETWRIGGYGRALINSLFIAAIVIVAVLFFVGLGAYALSKLNFQGKGFFSAYFFVAISLPGFLYIVPDYFVMNSIGLVDTHLSLILIYTSMQISFNMLLLRTFLLGIPRDVEEAAKIDGCSEINAFLGSHCPSPRAFS